MINFEMDHESIDKRKMLFLDSFSVTHRSESEWTSSLAKVLKMSDCVSLNPSKEFASRVSSITIGDLNLVSTLQTPIRVETPPSIERSYCLNLPYEGGFAFQIGNQKNTVHPGEAYWIDRNSDITNETGNYSGVAISFSSETLKSVAYSINPLIYDPSAFQRKMDNGIIFKADQRVERILLGQIRKTLMLIDPCTDAKGNIVANSGLDDLIAVRMAALIMPELISAEARSSSFAGGDAINRFDRLIDWIRANLSTELSMTGLSKVSGFSRDQLIAAFWDKFQASPIKWIQKERVKRLERLI